MFLFDSAFAPQLRYFALGGIEIPWTVPGLGNLTTLDLRRIPRGACPSPVRFREILSLSPALQRLCLDAAGPVSEEGYNININHSPVQLERLRVLVIGNVNELVVVLFFAQFHAPHVVDLTLINIARDEDDPTYSLLFMILTERFPEVRILTLFGRWVELVMNTREVVLCMNFMPLLRHLRVANVKQSFLDVFLMAPWQIGNGQDDEDGEDRQDEEDGEDRQDEEDWEDDQDDQDRDEQEAEATEDEDDDEEDLQYDGQAQQKGVIAPNLSTLRVHPGCVHLLASWLEERQRLGVPLDAVYILHDPTCWSIPMNDEVFTRSVRQASAIVPIMIEEVKPNFLYEAMAY